MSILLKEGRKEDLRKKYSDKFDKEVLDYVLNDSELLKYNHKYTDFVLKNMSKDMDVAWWIQEVFLYEIKLFEKYKNEIEKKDINQYESLDELQTALYKFRKKEEDKELEKEVDKIYEDDRFLVIVPKTHKASCKYGKGTKWCTTTANDSQHFERYTSGSQGLFYVIDKKNSTDDEISKIAFHYDGRNWRIYDSQDKEFSADKVKMIDHYFPELKERMLEYFKKNAKGVFGFLEKVFSQNIISTVLYHYPNGKILKVIGSKFELIKDLGFGHAMAPIIIVIDGKLVDKYDAFITFSVFEETGYSCSIGFSWSDDVNVVDTGLETFGLDFRSAHMSNLPIEVAKSIQNYIVNKVKNHIFNNENLLKYVNGGEKTFIPKYGYKFVSKDKGLIKKLIDWLELGKKGTKLDFLSDIKILKKKIENGEPYYRHYDYGEFHNSRFWRGQHASFFSAAKNAGILSYDKKNGKYFLIKGPNFDAFKEGKLRAL